MPAPWLPLLLLSVSHGLGQPERCWAAPPHTAVFDGHGGRAVSQFCAAHLAEEFVGCDAYRRGDLATAITEAYFRLDELLQSEEGRAELRQLVEDSKPK